MTKKDLFRVIIKLFGLYNLISFIPLFSSQLTFVIGASNWSIIEFVYLFLVLVVLATLSILLIFYPDTIIKWFKLDKKFDDNNVKPETSSITLGNLISFSIIIVGGIFIQQSFSPLVIRLGYLVQGIVNSRGIAGIGDNISNYDNYMLYVNILNLAIGYLLITNHRSLKKFLLSVNNKESNSND